MMSEDFRNLQKPVNHLEGYSLPVALLCSAVSSVNMCPRFGGGTRDHVKKLSEKQKSRLRRQLYEFGDSPRQTKTSDYAIVSCLAKERVKGSDRHEGQMEFA